MALTRIKTGGLTDNSVTDAKVADAITVSGAQTGITSVGTLGSLTTSGSTGSNYIGSFTNASATGWGLFVKGGADNADYSLRVQDKDAGDLLSVKSGGHIGLGTNDPANFVEILARDGVGDDIFALRVQNQEATDGRSYGLKVMAGSNSSDTTFELNDHDGSNVLMKVLGNGNTTFAGDVNVTADGARFFVSSADYELVSIGRAGSSGSALDQAYIRLKNAGTNTVAIHTAGDSYFNGGNVGIGHTSPQYGITMAQGNADGQKIGWEDAGNNKRGAILVNSVGDAMEFMTGTSDAVRMRITSGGYVTVGGSTTNNVNLTVNGTSSSARVVPQTDNTGYLGESNHRWQAVYATNGSIQTSDKNLKTSITSTDLGLDFINKLNPVSYKWKVGGYDITEATLDEKTGYEKTERIETPVSGKRKHYGLIAQEVKEVLGNNDFGGWVKEDLEDDDSLESLRYDQFVAPLVKAVQELSAKVEALENA